MSDLMTDLTAAYIVMGFLIAIYTIAKHDVASMLGCLLATIVSLIAWPLILIFWFINYALPRRSK